MKQSVINILSIAIVCCLIYNLVLKEKIKEIRKKKEINNKPIVKEEEPKEEIKKVTIDKINDLKPIKVEEIKKVKEISHEVKKYVKPSKDLLELYPQKDMNDEEILKRVKNINNTFKEFKVSANVCSVDISSQVCVYEIELIGNTRVGKVMNLENDLKLALGTKEVKMINPIPGKPYIGIEVKNSVFTPIGLRQMLKDIPSNKKIIVLGRDFYNNTKYIKLNDFENMLIAGRHSSGKNTFLYNIIITILLKMSPEEMKLVIIDPKRVDFSDFNDIPHLLTPIITDPLKACKSLQGLVVTMDDRYETFKNIGVKTIDEYNAFVEKELKKNPNCNLSKMPHTIVVINELADLMVVAPKEIEESIIRLSQFAKSVGIHLIVSTQRPSTDIISNSMKMNLQNRISFDVATGVDSRVILDTIGAENLFGNGDMLCRISGENELLHLQAPYISEEEIKRVVDFVKDENPFINDNEEKQTKTEAEDILYNEILDDAIKTGQTSASIIQRKYSIGYNRAARIIDMFEQRGIVGPAKGSKPREVLVKYEDKK